MSGYRRLESGERTMYEDLFDDDNEDDESEENTEVNTETSRRNVWGMGNHTHTPIEDDQLNEVISLTDEAVEVAPGLEDLVKEMQGAAREMSVSGFVCPECNIGHEHSDDKHDVRSDVGQDMVAGLGVSEEFAELMDTCPYCHCGAHEIAMLLEFANQFNRDIFHDVPTPSPDEDESQEWLDRVQLVNSAKNAALVPDHVSRRIEGDRQEIMDQL